MARPTGSEAGEFVEGALRIAVEDRTDEECSLTNDREVGDGRGEPPFGTAGRHK